MKNTKFKLRHATQHLAWTLNYLYTRGSKPQTIWIIDNYYSLAQHIDSLFKANWNIDYRSEVINLDNHPIYSRDLVYNPNILIASDVATIKFGDYLIVMNFEFSLDHNDCFMMSTNRDKYLSEDRIDSEECLNNIGKLISLRLRSLGLKANSPNAGERSSRIYYNTEYIDPSKAPKGSIHTPLGVYVNLYKRDYMENDTHSIFVPPGIAIHHSNKTGKSFTYDMIFPIIVMKDADFNQSVSDELFTHGL